MLHARAARQTKFCGFGVQKNKEEYNIINKGHENISPHRLDVLDQTDPDKAFRVRSSGGKKAGELRKKKKAIREIFETIMSTDVPSELVDDTIRALTHGNDNITVSDAMVAAIIRNVLVNGDEKSFNIAVKQIGQDLPEKTEITMRFAGMDEDWHG